MLWKITSSPVLASTTPVTPPIVKTKTKPTAKNIAVFSSSEPSHLVGVGAPPTPLAAVAGYGCREPSGRRRVATGWAAPAVPVMVSAVPHEPVRHRAGHAGVDGLVQHVGHPLVRRPGP